MIEIETQEEVTHQVSQEKVHEPLFIRWVLKSGIVRTEKGAELFLLYSSLIFLVFSFVLLFNHFFPSKPEHLPYGELPSNIRSQLSQKEYESLISPR